MAQHQPVVLIDDLDGSTAEQTTASSVDGQQYEIDLSRQNLQRLHDTLAPYLTNGRKVGPGSSTERRARRPRVATPATQPAATSTPAAEVATSTDSTTPAPRPPVPVALFSNPDEHVPSHTAAKPHTVGPFSAAG